MRIRIAAPAGLCDHPATCMEYETMRDKLHLPRFPRLLAGLLCVLSCGALAAGTTEADYFSELPEVLTVTRLAQPLSETPGAVTIIDRETIRRSGARELVDVLRLVPGYLVSGWNGANPNAVYHAPLDDFGIRNQVLVDGRSVYSTFLIGDTHRGMMGVLLEDIERIEVLRGTNSSAYGTNAMFGVVNIVTRDAADTHGTMLSVTRGAGGIDDNSARIGWGNERASFRLSAGRRADSGYLNAHDDKRFSQLHFRGDLRPDSDNEVTLSAGVVEHAAGEGFPGNYENAERTTQWRNAYLQGSWRRQLADGDQLKLSVSYVQERSRDTTPLDLATFGCGAPCVGIVNFDYSGTGRRLEAELQHTVGLSPQLRAVWGLSAKREAAESLPLYAVPEVAFTRYQLFGNFEWRPFEPLTINAGGLWERHSEVGAKFAPRLAANLGVAPGHTLRAALTRGFRTPSLFELKGDIRYYNAAGTLVGVDVRARGNVEPEVLDVLEFGYLGEMRDWGLTLDVRAFYERLLGTIRRKGYDPGLGPLLTSEAKDYINGRDARSQGLEYQLRWKASADTEIWLNQTFQRYIWDDKWDDHLPPVRTAMLALFQKLPANLDLSVMYHHTEPITWRGDKDELSANRRVDVRLGWPFRIGTTRVEAALAVQAANGNHAEFLPTQNFRVERRAFGTLRIEF